MSCLILDPQRSGQDLAALRILQRNEPVALPTETVYGLAARIGSDLALSRIFSLKARPHFDPLIVHVLNAESAAQLVTEVNELQQRLIQKFWPGPLTILFKKRPAVSDLCTSGSPLVALRSPAHPVFRHLLTLLGEPLAAPSANRFGRISPTSADDVVRELGPYGLEAVVDGGICQHGVESTIVDASDPTRLVLLRPGAIAWESLGAVAGPGIEMVAKAPVSVAAASAPGLLASHYAPRTPLIFVEDTAVPSATIHGEAAQSALLLIAPPRKANEKTWVQLPWRRVVVLSETGSDVEAAAHLFRDMRALDGEGLQRIYALKGPDSGLGLAINDRLRRAAGKGGGA
ncbi:MAG: threonylcarbamoyl-AMP synthase [Bdellovibrionales bacterium]|nr:threonylcarbamoyl-AMP synthase [Bdellovibrionales bacterium]